MAYIHRKAKPICCIQHQRFTDKRRDWRLLDLCIGLAGNIAVSGGDFKTSRTFIDIYSSPPKYDFCTKPSLLYSREFDAIKLYKWRYVCFLEEPNEVVTGAYNTLQVIAADKNKVLRSFKVKGIIGCVSVAEKNIFIVSRSNFVYVFNEGLNFLKTIRLEGLYNDGFHGDFVEEMRVVPGRFFVCTHEEMSLGAENNKVLAFRGTDGKELHTFTTQGARDVAVCLEYGILGVLFEDCTLEVFSLSGYHCILVFDMDSWANKVSISNRGVMVVGQTGTGVVKIYDIKSLFTYDYLKNDLTFLLQGYDFTRLLTHLDVPEAKTNYIMQRSYPTEALLQLLEDKCFIESSNVERIKEAFKQLNLKSCFYAVQIYQKSKDSTTSYERLLTKLSSHLSGDVLIRLCEYFKVSGDLKIDILTSQNPGYSFLLNLSDREVITETNVTALEKPTGNFGLSEALAEIRKYQSTVEELMKELQSDADLVVPVSTSPSLYMIEKDRRARSASYPRLRFSIDISDSEDDKEESVSGPKSLSSPLQQIERAQMKGQYCSSLLSSSEKSLLAQQRRIPFIHKLKKWFKFGQSELPAAADDDFDLSVGSREDDSKSVFRSSIRSFRQPKRYQKEEIIENVAQEEGNSKERVVFQDIDPFQKMAKWTKGGPTISGSLESATLDETKGPQSTAMKKNKKSDDIVGEKKTSPTETEVPENLEDLEKVTQVPIATSAALSLDFNGYQMEDLAGIEGATNDDQEFFFRTEGIKRLEATSSISKEGGLIEIPQSGVKLYIQPNSFSRDNEVHLITVKILLPRLFDDPASCFEHHSTVMVEVLPNNLKLVREAKLTLPHCLILKQPQYSDVQIFHSHHAQDQTPQWENISNSVRCELSEASCSIWITNFSWIKCDIGGEYVEGKKLFVYTLGEKFTKDSNNVTAEVGYFPALPGNDRIPRHAHFDDSMRGTVYESKLRAMFCGTWQLIFFRKEPRNSLMISISEIIPNGGWEASPGSACRKEISYQNIEMSIEQNWPFTFQRNQSEAPFPVVHFKVFQGDESFSTPVYVNMEKGLIKEESDVASNNQPRTLLELGDQHISNMSPVCANNNDVVEVNSTSLMLSKCSVTDNQQERQVLHHQFLTWPKVAWNRLTMSLLSRNESCQQASLQIFQKFTYNEISHVAGCLDREDALGKDWKMLADYLQFSYGDIMNFEKQPRPTEAVIRSACQSGTLTDKSQLIRILHKMGRKDAAIVLECQTE